MRSHSPLNKLKFLSLLLLVGLGWYLGRKFPLDILRLQGSLEGLPLALAGLGFIGLYVSLTFALWFSKDLFWLAGALIFGGFYSGLLVWVAELINGWLLFCLARWLGRAWVKGMLKERYVGIEEKINNLRFSWLVLLRAAPLVPYRFMDLAAGLSAVSLRKYLAAATLGSPVKIFWLQYILAAVGQAALQSPYRVAEFFIARKGLLALSLLYLLLVVLAAARIKRKT
jgi:uncharacterized membrane protein YdjX (TVP38/TMEM64 family)